MVFSRNVGIKIDKKTNKMKYLTILLIVITLSACAINQTYKGPKLSSGKVATIKAFHYYDLGLLTQHESFYLVKSNGILVGGSPLWEYPKYIEVLPGKTKITLLYHTNLFNKITEAEQISGSGGIPVQGGYYVPLAPVQRANIELEFNAEAGKSYKIMFYPNILSKKNTIPKPWVVDLRSKEIVFGEVPETVKNPTFIR